MGVGWIVINNPTKNPIKLEENRCSSNAYTFYKNNLEPGVNEQDYSHRPRMTSKKYRTVWINFTGTKSGPQDQIWSTLHTKQSTNRYRRGQKLKGIIVLASEQENGNVPIKNAKKTFYCLLFLFSFRLLHYIEQFPLRLLLIFLYNDQIWTKTVQIYFIWLMIHSQVLPESTLVDLPDFPCFPYKIHQDG